MSSAPFMYMSRCDWLRSPLLPQNTPSERCTRWPRLSIGGHRTAYNVPRVLAGSGIVASLLMGLCAYLFVIFPELANVVPVGLYGGPIFLFELTIGFWLLVKGIRLSMGDGDEHAA